MRAEVKAEANTGLTGLTGGENSKISAYPGYYEDRRVEHVVPREAVKAGHYECWMEVSCNGLYGIGINGQRHHEPDVSALRRKRRIPAERTLISDEHALSSHCGRPCLVPLLSPRPPPRL
jgi:hypothetical protein